MFGINKKLRNQALIYGRTKGEIYVSRGENVLYLTTSQRKLSNVQRLFPGFDTLHT